MELSESISIAAPIERVWSVMIDVERWPEWSASIDRVQKLSDGDLAVGSRVAIKQPRLPRAVWQVTELEPGRSFTWASRGPGIRTVAAHRLAVNVSGGTDVTLSLRSSGPAAWLLGWWLGKISRLYVRYEAEGLKRRCEE